MSETKAEYRYVRPLPCVRDEDGETREQTVKQLFAKIDEELNELKAAILKEIELDDYALNLKIGLDDYALNLHANVAEEAADTITAITTLCSALGIDAEMRDDAQRWVNEKNRERYRL